MTVKKEIFSVLSSILPTYQFEAPANNVTFPLCIYYLVNEQFTEILGDKPFGRSTIFSVKIYSETDDEDLVNQVESTILNTFPFISMRSKRENKEEGLFLTEYDFQLLRGK
jgi:hypothetical protein